MIIKEGNKRVVKGRDKLAEKIFNKIPYRYCFITGSFLYYSIPGIGFRVSSMLH